ncbi:MAG: MBL fold metallo-hydrolase [Prevotellaceae bacterium]|jgi:glyoxylase-like metal-dependent hydrolase (beta-lactamase superfamily II)|nr:MBL fold metallo-hydrolase [Prevotellaceae bacterium]
MRTLIIVLTMSCWSLTAGAQVNPNVYSHRVGAYEIVLLAENQGTGNTGILVGATPEMLQKAIPNGTYPNAVNAFLVKTPTQNILFDTGFGRNLEANLAAVNVKPEQIDLLVITHMHGDHIGGMLKDGKKAFPNAQLVLSDIEKEYWIDNQKNEGAIRAYEAYKGDVKLIEPELADKKTADGLFFFEAYGHTPGHIACLIKSGADELLIWGDLAHAMAIQMPFPEVSVRYDSDPAEAAESRKQLLKYVAAHQIPIAGMHVAYPGMGKITAAGTGYVFTPMR